MSESREEQYIRTIKDARNELIAAYIVAIESDDKTAEVVLGKRVAVPMTVEEQCVIADALGYYPGGLL